MLARVGWLRPLPCRLHPVLRGLLQTAHPPPPLRGWAIAAAAPPTVGGLWCPPTQPSIVPFGTHSPSLVGPTRACVSIGTGVSLAPGLCAAATGCAGSLAGLGSPPPLPVLQSLPTPSVAGPQPHCWHLWCLLAAIGSWAMAGCCGPSTIAPSALATALVLGFCLLADCGATAGCGRLCPNAPPQNGVPLGTRPRGCLLVPPPPVVPPPHCLAPR